MKHILSYGGGVNSTALLFLIIEKKLPLDEVIFADTGAEMPETYNYIPDIQNFCEQKGIEFTILKAKVNVKRDLPEMKSFSNLRDYCFAQKIIPFRKFRSCTDKFKIQPINNYLKKYNCEIILYIGFDYGEVRRKRISIIPWIENSFPLIDYEINRLGCKKIIEKNEFPIPVKSGCYICPFQGIDDWKELRIKHRDLFDDAILLEENAQKRNKQALFTTLSLKKLDRAIREQKHLKFMRIEGCHESCEYGICMT